MLYTLLFIIAFISMIILLYIDVKFIIEFLIVFIILMVSNYIVSYIMSKLRIKVLYSDCDPERYLKMLDNQEKRFHSKPRIVNYLAVNRAAGYILLRDYQTAKEYLEGIDLSYLSDKNGSFLAYTINLILCHYELGEIDKAEILYETSLVRLCTLEKRLKKSVEILIGERYFYLKNMI